MDNWTKVEDTDIIKQDVEQWIKIIVETERDLCPANDITGEMSKNNRLKDESGKLGKWFLMGSFGNDTQIFRDLANYTTIESNTDVLIIAVSTDASNAELRYRNSSIEELKTSARQIFDLHEVVEVTIDGERIDKSNGLQEVMTDVIDVELPENNVYQLILDAKGGPTKLVCFAWAIEVKFEPGEHEIVLHTYHPPNKELEVNGFNQDVKYRIKVV
jgi:hypothetical protein